MFYQIEEYSQLTDQLFKEWQQLWEQSGCAHIFNSPQWFLTCIKVFPSTICRIITMRGKGRLCAVLPLCAGQRFGVKTLSCLAPNYSSKSTFLIEGSSKILMSELADYLARQGNFYLESIDEKIAEQARQSRRLLSIEESSESPFLPLSIETPSVRSKNSHAKLRSRLKKYESHLVFQSYPGSLEALNTTFAIDEQSRKPKQGKATFKTEEDKRFFRQLVLECKDRVVIDLLYYDNTPFVFSINLVYKDVYHALKTAFNEQYKRLAPGRLLNYYILQHAKKQGFKILDYSRGATALKKEFTPFAYKQYDAFYSSNILVWLWWKLAAKYSFFKTKLYENQALYKKYFAVKQNLRQVSDILAGAAKSAR